MKFLYSAFWRYGLIVNIELRKLIISKMVGGRMEKTKVAICPECGEVSIYLDDVERLKNLGKDTL